MGIKNITSSIYTIEPNDNLLNCHCVATNINLYFTNAKNYTNNITIKKVDAANGICYIHAASGETIEGNSTIQLSEINDYKTLTPTKDGWVISGSSLDMSSLSSNEILMKNTGSTVKGSGITQVGTELESELSLVLPPNSLHLGDNITMHENGGAIEYHTETSNANYILIVNKNAATGSEVPFYFKHAAKQTSIAIQSDDSQTMNSVASVSATFPANIEAWKMYFKLVNAVNNFKMKVTVNGTDVGYYPSKNAWNDNTVDGYNLGSGTVSFDLDPHFSFLTTYSVTFTFKGDSAINMRGDGSVCWFAVDQQLLTKQNIALDVTETTTFLNNANQAISIGANTIRNALIIYYANDTVTYEGGEIILVSNGTTSEIDTTRIGSSDVVIDTLDFTTSIVDSNLILNITATGDGSKTVTFKYKIFSIS